MAFSSFLSFWALCFRSARVHLPIMKSIVFTVTNGLAYDQRMQRICTSLAKAGFNVRLIGRETGDPLPDQPFAQTLLPCRFRKGFAMYAGFNLRLLGHLLLSPAPDAYCAIDLDTILPVLFVSWLKRKPRVYDAHELFTEQKEIVTRPRVKKIWDAIERFAVPKYEHGYTVNLFIQQELGRRYGSVYGIVRNLPLRQKALREEPAEKYPRPTVLYQGAVNEGRSFETLIPAMKHVDAMLLVCGTGNFMDRAVALAKEHGVYGNRVSFMGAVLPAELKMITPKCHIGVTLFEPTGLNQYYSLANRFFDYMMGGIPQVCVGYPEYAAIVREHPFALLVPDTAEQTIAEALNKLLSDNVLQATMAAAAVEAQRSLNWETEAESLTAFWDRLLV